MWNTKYVANRWLSVEYPGDGKTPFRDNGIQHSLTDYQIEDAGFIALRDVTLGYDLPRKAARKVGLSKLRVYVSAQNLLYLWSDGYRGINPEARYASGVYRTAMARNALQYRTERKDVITTPKTEQSVRVIDIPQFLTQEIKDYVDKLYELPDDERIFPIVAEAVQHKLKHNCEKTGVKKIRVHDIRHSHVAYLINQGVQPLIIKERLGHRDIKITLNTYGHLYPNQQRQVADMLNQQRTEKVPTAATVRT